MMATVWQNGHLAAMEEALIPVGSPAVLSARAVFDGCRVFARRNGGAKLAFTINMSRHIFRLRRSCEALRIALPYTDYDLSRAAASVITAARLTEDAGLRWFVTEVSGDDGAPASVVTVFVRSLKGYTKPDPYRLNFARRTRWVGHGIPHSVKTMSHYAGSRMETMAATQAGFNDCVFVNQFGHVTETPRANLLFLTPDEIHSPCTVDGLLPGITCESLHSVLRHTNSLRWTNVSISVRQLASYTGVLMLSSSLGIVPVSQIGPFRYSTAASNAICDLWSLATSHPHSFFPSAIDEFTF